jgi:hypothetical protein
MTVEVFLNELLKKVPELTSVYDEHLYDYEELLPHVLMAEITRFIVKLANKVIKNKKDDNLKLSVILDHFENALNEGNEELTNIIVVSFLENLETDIPAYSFLKSQFGKELKNSLKVIENYLA